MKFSFKPQHLKRLKDVALLLLKYGQSDVVRDFGLDDTLEASERERVSQQMPDDLATDLERMGPTFVKVGQLLSSRPDLLPPAYLVALARLQDKVKPFPYEQVEEIVMSELGVRLSKAFNSFDRTPLAAASLGQVHRATLRDGRPVVVKVQRPGIRQQIADDLELMEEFIGFLATHTRFGQRHQLDKIFREFQVTLTQELDYLREASQLTQLAENLKEFPHLQIPLPVNDYTTRCVLTMDYIRGRKITALSPLVRLDIDGAALADELFHAYLKQVLVDGLFHADPHPGNVFLTDDNRVALVDLGMVGRTSGAMQERLIKLLLAISEGNADDAADIAIAMSETGAHFDQPEFRRSVVRLVLEQQNNTLREIDIGRAILELGRNAGATGLYVPTELTMLGKALLQLDEIGKTLHAEFNPTASVRQHVSQILNQRLRKQMSPGNVLASMLEMRDFMATLPARLNKLLDAIISADIEVKVRTVDINLVLSGFQKIANRIAAGLVLAALIIGASLLMQVQSAFTIFGYPGLAIICFILAATGGFWLVIVSLFHDRKDRRKLPRD